jgi:Cellulase (glycosyl hydrolase family 5)
MDPYLFPDGGKQAQALVTARNAGATYARLLVRWMSIAPATLPPTGFDASDPSSPDYDWSGLDGKVEAAEAAGVTPILDIISAPGWATVAGGVNPRVRDLQQFAHALALHYDGSHGAPAEHVFQVWNEPNLSLDLDPVRPAVYRAMVNKAAAAIHNVGRANLVVAGGTDPFKNKAKRFHTMAPLAFMRAVLCLSKGAHPHRTCKAKVHFDVWAHHPYTFGGPFGHARHPDDVSLGDLPTMAKLLRTAKHMHQIVSRGGVQFWVTEFAWDTRPPRRHALKLALQARATEGALYQMWRSGVSLATWFLLQDAPGRTPYKSGLYFGGRPIAKARAKPTLKAFRFPFVAYREGGVVHIWGRDATSDKKLVTIQLRHGRRWRTVARVRTNIHGIFLANLHLNASTRDWLRARAAGSGTSLAFSLEVPRYPHVGPWGN